MGGRGWAGWSGVRGGKWDNCNSIISKYIKKNKIKKKELKKSMRTLSHQIRDYQQRNLKKKWKEIWDLKSK